MSPRILIVDDEPSLVRGLKYALERERFEVESASDGEEAIKAALDHAVDLVVLDLMLPGVSGIDVCRRVRETSSVPIIMLTAKDAERDLLEGLQSGADDYMTKPFSTVELVERIRALLRRLDLDRVGTDTVRDVGPIRIDLLHDQVSIDGTKVVLTPSEFKILSALAGNPGAVFSRRQLLERLWDSDHIGDEHTCEVHISSLRRKIEPNPAEPIYVLTVRGQGYKLAPL